MDLQGTLVFYFFLDKEKVLKMPEKVRVKSFFPSKSFASSLTIIAILPPSMVSELFCGEGKR